MSETDGAVQPNIPYVELAEELHLCADQRDGLNEACLRLEAENADLHQQLAAAQAREQELRHELHSRWLDTEYDQDDNDLFVAYWCRKCNGSGAEWDSIDHDPDCELADKPDHTALNAALAAARRAGAADWRGRCVEHLNSQAKASASSTAILYYAIAREVSCLPLEETT